MIFKPVGVAFETGRQLLIARPAAPLRRERGSAVFLVAHDQPSRLALTEAQYARGFALREPFVQDALNRLESVDFLGAQFDRHGARISENRTSLMHRNRTLLMRAYRCARYKVCTLPPAVHHCRVDRITYVMLTNEQYCYFSIIRVVGRADVVDGMAFLADEEGLRIVDVSSPSQPRFVSALPIQGGNAQHVEVVGQRAYVSSPRGFHIVDVS